MIRKATLDDIDSILNITQACAQYMINNGIFQWDENYPNKRVFELDVSRGELFVIEDESAILGCIVISSLIDDEYLPIQWLTETSRNLYVHRLAIDPGQQGNGLAQQLMSFAETYGIENDYVSIRLDTFSQNKRNQKFYELRGYKRLGNVFFPNQSDHPFYCYELVL